MIRTRLVLWLTFGAAVLLGGPAPSAAADLTIGVPVSLSQLDARVTSVDVTCQANDTRANFSVGLATTQQPIDPATGNFSGTVNVVITVADPSRATQVWCWLSRFRTATGGASPIEGAGGGDNIHHVRSGAVLRIDRMIQ